MELGIARSIMPAFALIGALDPEQLNKPCTAARGPAARRHPHSRTPLDFKATDVGK
jgi:hypothetical protein